MRFWTLERQLVAGYVMIATIIVGVGAISAHNAQRLDATNHEVAHTHQVLGELERTLTVMLDAETGTRGYVITGQTSFLEPYDRARATIDEQLRGLKQLVAGDPDQQLRLQALEQLVARQLEYRAGVIDAVRTRGMEATRQIVSDGVGKVSMDALRKVVAEMRQEEERLLRLRQQASEQSSQRADVMVNTLRILILAVLIGSYLTTRRHAALRARAEDELRKVNAGLEDRVRQRTAELETAGAALRDAETFTRATMNALFAHISVLDKAGNIVAVNRVWRDFAATNGVDPDTVSEGSNYFDVCAAATGAERATALAIAEGIRSVALGRTDRFDIEYPCHSPAERRWFIASVKRFLAGDAVRIVVSHVDITQRREAEDAIRRQSEELQAINEDLERFNGSVVNRELRMIELKQEINELCSRLGQPPRYAPDAGEEPA